MADDPFGALDAAPSAPTSPVERASAWVLQTQRDLHRRLTLALHTLDAAPTARTAGILILASFLYGVFHAAGPGHGKAVISAYLITHPQTLRRGIGLSFAASMMQGVTAIGTVLILTGLLGWLARDALGQVRGLELASFFLVALLGLWLVLRGLRSAWRIWRTSRHPAVATLEADPHPPGEPGRIQTLFRRIEENPRPAGLLGSGHAHTPECGCGTPHHVDPNQRGPWLATVLAVGIRPCSGAVLVMAVSLLLGIWMAGVAAVLVMSLGTALTVSVLAILAVKARDWAVRVLQPTPLSRLRYAGAVAGILGGTIIALLGWTLFKGTLMAEPLRHPLGL
jgi:ABC-type nickel/cobalt efflux system permease component RcnA